MVKVIADQWPLRRGSLIYPMPVAIACGRVLRARTAAERVNASLKAAEVLTRYLAAVAVASFASRNDEAEAKLSELSGKLSFGHFLRTVQEVAGAKGNHPAAPLLAQGFKTTKRNNLRGKTDAALVALLELRNGDGHDLRNLDEAKAIAIEATAAPVSELLAALDGVDAILSKPLFVVENQEWTRDALILHRLVLMGESDPTPESIKVNLGAGVGETHVPYIAINSICLQLPPWLLWGIDRERQNFSLLFLDAVDGARTRYRTLDGGTQYHDDGLASSVRELCSGSNRAPDMVVLLDGRHLANEWGETRNRIEESGRREAGRIDWHAFDTATVRWYAARLGPDAADPHALIRERLLDGRFLVEPDELRQIRLLFGTPAAVRGELQRAVLDLRVIEPKTMRPAKDKRDTVESANLIQALMRAVRFFAEQTGLKDVDLEDLSKTEGTIDYLTLREIFVNQTIHQDYRDSSAAAQIEIHPDRVTVFNTGYSLVPTDKLLDGGKSQSRNPLIARALRLIGFAEISGSGIRAVHRACQQAHRRAPTFESKKDTNTFSLTLHWSEGAADIDAYWQTLVGRI
ncbi:ATP-binding protein [uncultured Lamprocystis sp.]|jgi:hypothetical protein|uniref:ATP-binding protein n=1 Tax=uncultured Lamprocystis sp. TaxID=543132 RepID=UPI0025E4CB5E|nr:ATP-binding protein [uncultured Lamprocystis sp.]